MTYARWSFGLAVRGKDGATTRAHLEASAKRGNLKAKAALVAPPVPAACAYLWAWFLELHGRRGTGATGPAALTWPDFAAWAACTKREPSPWEYGVLAALDNAFFAVVAETA